MSLIDLQDAGILAGFERWGWPWHGLIQSGIIGTTGRAHAQPETGDAWLIDTGIAAPDMTPDEIADEASAGRTWLNYALVPVGLTGSTNQRRAIVYGTALPSGSFLHIDDDGACWRVVLSGVYDEMASTVTVTATLNRFGLIKIDGSTNPAAALIADTVSVVSPVPDYIQSPVGYGFWLMDVHTNGDRALFGLYWINGAIRYGVISCIEVSFSGAGGADGSGLVMSLAEVLAVSDLMGDPSIPFANVPVPTGVDGANPSSTFVEFTCVNPTDVYRQYDYTYSGEIVLGNELVGTGSGFSNLTLCRTCFYNSSGAPTALILSQEVRQELIINSVSPGSQTTPEIWLCNGTITPATVSEPEVVALQSNQEKFELRLNSAVIASAVFDASRPLRQYKPFGLGWQIEWTAAWSYSETGSFVSILQTAGISAENIRAATAAFNSLILVFGASSERFAIDNAISEAATARVGVRVDGAAAALYFSPTAGSARAYDTIATPSGPASTSLTSDWFFARNRKTLAWGVYPAAACWV